MKSLKTKPVSNTSQLNKRQLQNKAQLHCGGARVFYYLKAISLSTGNLQGNNKAIQTDVRRQLGQIEQETAYCIILK